MTTDFDVVVIGYGPSGLVAAAALGRRGHRVLVLERWPALYGLPRLTHIDGETARIIQNVADVDVALRDAKAVDSYRWNGADDEHILTVDWSGTSCGFPAHISMFQPDIEDAIDASVRACPNVEVNQGWAVVALTQDDERVTVRAREWSRDRAQCWANEATERTVSAKYVIGADGANSFVRSALGIERIDLGVDDVWLNVDVECVKPLPERFAQSSQFCNPVRPNMFMPIGAGRQRFEVAVLPGESHDEAADPAHAWTWLRERHDLGPEDVRILRQIVYVFSARNAVTWRANRVLLAGDAAHTMPPYMGQGACSGMRDAITLAWKLDLVLRGVADDALLDTYELERRPHAEAIQGMAIHLGHVANTLDHAQAQARDAALRGGEIPQLPPFPIVENGVVAVGFPLAGTLAPQGRTSAGLLDTVVGWGFHFVTNQDPAAVLTAAGRATLERLGGVVLTTAPGHPETIDDADGTYAQYFRANDVAGFVMRPDFHLFGAAKTDRLGELVDRLAAALTPELVFQ